MYTQPFLLVDWWKQVWFLLDYARTQVICHPINERIKLRDIVICLREILLVLPNFTQKRRQQTLCILDIEDYSIQEKSRFENVVDVMNETLHG